MTIKKGLKGKIAIVLGASAEGGTGWAIAEKFAEAGVTLVIAARSEKGLKKLAKKTAADYCICDAANPENIKKLVDDTVEKYGKIDIAVNAAGLPMLGSISQATNENLQRALDVNYLGNVHFIKNITNNMKDDGSIVLISSLSAKQPIAPHFAYACAKAATDCLVKYAAIEYGGRGIRVNSVLPGPIRSHMARELFNIPGVEDIYAKEIPLHRIAEPEDIADAVLWLCGPAFVTGLNLDVNGGNQLTRMPRADELPFGESSYESDFK